VRRVVLVTDGERRAESRRRVAYATRDALVPSPLDEPAAFVDAIVEDRAANA
jgi:hypothetical protein